MTQQPVFRKLHNGLAELFIIAKTAQDGDYKEAALHILSLLSTCINNRDSDVLFHFADDVFKVQPPHIQEYARYIDNVYSDAEGVTNYNYIHKHRRLDLYYNQYYYDKL